MNGVLEANFELNLGTRLFVRAWFGGVSMHVVLRMQSRRGKTIPWGSFRRWCKQIQTAQQTTKGFHLLKTLQWSAGPSLPSALQTTEGFSISEILQWSEGTFPPSARAIVLVLFSLGTSSKKMEQANLPGGVEVPPTIISSPWASGGNRQKRPGTLLGRPIWGHCQQKHDVTVMMDTFFFVLF